MSSTVNQAPEPISSQREGYLRKPTEEELNELSELVAEDWGDENAACWIEFAYIAVFPDYCTGQPGYFGKLMTVVWGGSPSFYDVYIWRGGKLVHVDKDH